MNAFFENRDKNLFAIDSHGLSFPLHLHPHPELFYLVSGETSVTVRKRTQVLTAGSIAIIFPNQIHSYTAMSPDSHAIVIICDISQAGNYSETLLRHHPSNPFLTPDEIHPNVRYSIDELLAEKTAEDNAFVYPPLIQLILARTIPNMSLHRNHSSDSKELTYQIAQYVNENYRERITLEGLSHELGVSKYYLSHIFSEKFEQNFSAYLSGIRLVEACNMLSSTNLSVTEISEEAGFESQRSFFRVFKEAYGVTPLNYRRQVQHLH